MLASLDSPEALYFPVRHHSPACAWHLARLIRERKPRAVLVEGPHSFTPLIPLLLDARTKPPVAIYTASEVRGRRRAAWYPFADCSPEMVALREGHAAGARLRFIDLDYAAQTEANDDDEDGAPRTDSLMEERHLARSALLDELARRTGCRDHNDLWDHLFETRLGDGDSMAFARDAAAWCYYSRATTNEALMLADGTHAREAHMAALIQEEIAKGGPVLVVTGGFHTVVLPSLVKQATGPLTSSPIAPAWLVRYSFQQLDALNGYSAGMPSPYYYDQLWHAARENPDTAAAETAARVLVTLGRMTRTKRSTAPLSPADEIAALEQASRLAALRGHAAPLREDLLDGVRSSFVKGSLDAEGLALLELARDTLTGHALGEVPPECGVPPIVDDFRATAAAMKLNLRDALPKKVSLDLYRRTAHRRTSRFLHRLRFLNAPFGTMLAGPDFIAGRNVERRHEEWECCWSPQTESALIDAAVDGATVGEACVARLLRLVGEWENAGTARRADCGVELLLRACVMGLHAHTARLREIAAEQMQAEPSIGTLTKALTQLRILQQSREPLEAHQLPDIPLLLETGWNRACYLLHDAPSVPPDDADEWLAAITSLHGLAVAESAALDATAYWPALQKIAAAPAAPALLTGGAAGLLHAAGFMNDDALTVLLTGYLDAAASDAGAPVQFLTGLLRTARELAWRLPALTEAAGALMEKWSDEEFVSRLPHLRLAFSGLTPAETDRVAGVIADSGTGSVGPLYDPGLDESTVLAAVELELRVRAALRADGLEDFAPLP